jgi:hypothetical protein
MSCRTVERAMWLQKWSCRACLSSKSLLSSAGCSAESCSARAYDRTSGPSSIFFFSACCRNHYETFEQGIIEEPACPTLQSASDKTTSTVVSIYRRSWTPAGGSVLLFGYGSQCSQRHMLRQASAAIPVCTLRPSSDSHQMDETRA